MTRVKICGLTEIEHALTVSEAGADLFGLVFASSRRQVPLDKALQLVEAVRGLNHRPAAVGVFVNTAAPEVNRVAEYCQLDWVQLNGDETWQYCQEIEKPIIKALRISPDNTTSEILGNIETGYQLFASQRLICLLDTQVGDYYGGTGQAFNWQLAEEVAARFPVIIAGGLTTANIEQLVRKTKPWGVDVSTGVETSGQKDASKIRTFIEAVRKAERDASQLSEPDKYLV
ncbi:phosphoribosylanthranilate isomerase [Chloroflexota bacterium]